MENIFDLRNRNEPRIPGEGNKDTPNPTVDALQELRRLKEMRITPLPEEYLPTIEDIIDLHADMRRQNGKP